jgi:hypothetical protein
VVCASAREIRATGGRHAKSALKYLSVLTITILGTICGAHNWVEIKQWGEAQQAWLREFLELPHGIPSHDRFGRVFARLDLENLHQAFMAWMSALAQRGQEIIALDGKTIRRSLDRADGRGPIHVVSAWASRAVTPNSPLTLPARLSAAPDL